MRPRRIKRIALIALAVVLFIAISGLLARFLTVENLERDEDLELVQAEAKGNAAAMIDKLSGCNTRPSCVASMKRVAANPRVHRRGAVKILDLESQTAYSFSGATGKTRLAWAVIGTLPIVQCIEVRRTGNFLEGIKISLIGLSAPIPNEADC